MLFATQWEPTNVPTPMVCVSNEGTPWVEGCIRQHPEILWLADEEVRKTEEGDATLEGGYSEQIFGQKYIEFDRTIMTLHCLKLILNGSDGAYETFTADQPEGIRLSRESFSALHVMGQELLTSGWGGLNEMEMAQALGAGLVLGDIGKSERARALFKPYGIGAPDHDDFHEEVMQVLTKHPEMSLSFARLPDAAQKLLTETVHLAHYGHITHLEGGAEMFTQLAECRPILQDSAMLSFDLLVHICDVAGAFGHRNNHSSLVYTEPSFQAMEAVGDSVRLLADPEKSEIDAYNHYLGVRAAWLGLNADDPYERALARIGAMLRLFTPEEGAVLKKAMVALDPDQKAHIALALDIQEKDPLHLRTPTYMPAVLINLSNNLSLGNTKEDRLFQAVKSGLPFIAKVLTQHRKLVAKGNIDPRIPLCFNGVAGAAKNAPELLQGDFSIDKEGNVMFGS